jgi:amidase
VALSDFTYVTATEMPAGMVKRRVSSMELTQVVIAWIEHYGPKLNAVGVRDFEQVLVAARDADEARARGETRPLLGIPMTIKESFNIAGLPTTRGIPFPTRCPRI